MSKKWLLEESFDYHSFRTGDEDVIKYEYEFDTHEKCMKGFNNKIEAYPGFWEELEGCNLKNLNNKMIERYEKEYEIIEHIIFEDNYFEMYCENCIAREIYTLKIKVLEE